MSADASFLIEATAYWGGK